MKEIQKVRNFCIIAHIDHGKSTLADRFLELTKTVESRQMRAQYLDTMDLERERGITIKLQPVKIKYKDYILNMIDTPGHVDFSYEVSRSLAAVEGAILLVDATQGIQAQTLSNLFQAKEQGLDIIPVINKIDLPQANEQKTSEEIMSVLNISKDKIIKVSAKTGENVEEVLKAIITYVRPPKGEEDKTRALIFDSIYDSYRGVIAYVRVVDGAIKSHDSINMLATNAQDEALEVGVFSPKLIPQEKLSIGDIGYVVTGFKDIDKCQVGDTLTISNSKSEIRNSKISDLKNQNGVSPLPGYKKIKPMIFASIYSINGEVNALREALGKLKLNDSSLSYEPENSKAFGFGFKCGFLGLLHLEIIKERLEREYNLDLIVTTPQVKYIEHNSGVRTEYEEPWVKLDIVTPELYLGQIMDLAQKSRAKYIITEYLADRVLLKYEAPLASVIMNFYDRLKSVSSGYASMNYDFIGYRSGDLVKMDVLIAGEKIDVLSHVVHKNDLNSKAHDIVKKLKELLPRQMFQVSIQAAIGGKILAREDISAMKKDVTGYLYGGDITRKKKLWAKQAKGKKKMKKLGRVDIPSDVFIKLLKY
jgi:GTP-binding protein LepA